MIKTQLIGRLGADAEVTTLQSGTRVMKLNIAVDLSYRDKEGNKVEKTQWVRATQWNLKETATIQNYLKKGGQVYIEGEPSASAYTNKDGAAVGSLEIKITDIRLLGSKDSNQPSTTASAPVATPSNLPPGGSAGEDDDLPF